MPLPVLWSFRRCPYAMRARLAILSSGVRVELREVVLRNKPEEFLAASPSATVPCLDTGAEIIDESLDVMIWALRINDPEGWLGVTSEAYDLISMNDGAFKTALDRYKYSSRYENVDAATERSLASQFLCEVDAMLARNDWLFGANPSIADMAILPFVRQFAHVDIDWFNAQPWPNLIRWLDNFMASERFAAVMRKFILCNQSVHQSGFLVRRRHEPDW